MRPYIISHMIASIDGRIDCAMVDKISGDEYYAALRKLNCPSTVAGRVTMQMHYAEPEPFVPSAAAKPIGRAGTYVAQQSQKGYTIAVDTRGTLRWTSAYVDDLPLVCIVSEQATEEYLIYLREQGISWIAAGQNAIDLPRAMELLHDKFGVQRLAVVGGGHINGAFLTAGLLDEVSLMIAPGIDARAGMAAVFDGQSDAPDWQPTKLHLTGVEHCDGGTVWLRYKVGEKA